MRYEYFRAEGVSKYYCLLSFKDRLSFLQHQVSDYHEGFDFASMIASLDMEWIDPVGDASPLKPTEADDLPGDASKTIRGAAEIYPVAVQPWWLGHREA